jgi:hypothetical protein
MLASRSLGVAVCRHTGKKSIHQGLSFGLTEPVSWEGQTINYHYGCFDHFYGFLQPYPYPSESSNEILQGSVVVGVRNLLSTVANRPTAIVASTALFLQDALTSLWNDGLLLISTLKRRRKMMNKHKLRKRKKKNRMSSKK